MPRLWSRTIEAHRREVRETILHTTAALVGEHGLRAVTMSQIAEEAGIGRATLYKYFRDVESILLAWHERQIAAHLLHLAEIRDGIPDPDRRLPAVLEAFALVSQQSRGRHGTDFSAFLHRDHHVAHAQHQVQRMIRDLISEGAKRGSLRDDVPPDELAIYCVHALAAAASLPSKSAVRRLVDVTLAALQRST